MVQENLIGVAADGVTDLGNEPLTFSTLNPSNTPADPRRYGRLRKGLGFCTHTNTIHTAWRLFSAGR